MLAALPEGPQRDRSEMDIQMALGSALTTTGWGAPEKERAYGRARELAERLGEDARVFRALFHLGTGYISQSKPRLANELGAQCLRIAMASGDRRLLMGAHHLAGESSFWLGRVVEGERDLERAAGLYDPQRDHDLVAYYGMDPFGLSCGMTAWTRQILGRSDQALSACSAALARARELSHAYSVAFTLMIGAVVHLMQGNAAATRTALTELLPLCAEHGLSEIMVYAEWAAGWAAFQEAGSGDAIAQSCEALRWADRAGGTPGLPWHKGVIAEMHAAAGDLAAARSVLDEAFETARLSEQHFYDAELHRIAGQLALAANSPDLAAPERSFRAAIDDAREREARWWELRAARDLARLWGEQGRRVEAGDLLAPVYDWFTEGFDTTDLKEAKARRDELR